MGEPVLNCLDVRNKFFKFFLYNKKLSEYELYMRVEDSVRSIIELNMLCFIFLLLVIKLSRC